MTLPPIRYSKKAVLIVEDFSQYAYALRGMMINIGCQHVDLAYNGKSAIQACKEIKYDIILCDYNLGDSKDGQQILEELHSFNLLKKTSVFIIVSAESTREMVMGAIELQPDGYLTKPFNGHTLQFRLEKAINKKEILAPVILLINKKKFKPAIEKCHEIIKLHPKFRMICLQQIFNCLRILKDFKAALKLTINLVNEKPIPWAMLGIGEVFYQTGEIANAETAFSELINTFPLIPEGYDWLAKIQYELGQTTKAQETLVKAVLISPKALARQRKLGQLAEENDDFDTMGDAFRQAVRFGKHSAFASPEEFIKLTKAIGMQLRGNSVVDRDKLINEAKSVFSNLNEQFEFNPTTKFRSEVAHADFSSVTNNTAQVNKHLKLADKFFDRVEEMLSPNESIEISDSLKHLGRQDLVEVILENAVEQYFDDPRFMKKASRLTNNKHLLLNAKKAEFYNRKATILFKKKDYPQAIENFIKASEIAPNNVNINLNHAQVLLKVYVSNKKNRANLEKAEEILKSIPYMSITDPRNQRYLELLRLSQVIQQNI